MLWTKLRSRDEHIKFIRDVSSVCASRGGDLSQYLNNLVQSNLLREVVEYEFDYEQGYTVEDYCYARQIAALVSKQEFLELGYDKRKSAIMTFLKAERSCLETNRRLEFQLPTRDVGAVLHYANLKIAEVLGDVPSLDRLKFLFGPGATTNVKGSVANARRKLSARMVCSEEMLPVAGEFLAEFPLWVDACSDWCVDDISSVPVEISPGRLDFVPKNSKTFRSICVEPVLNSLFQKGIGTFLKQRLLKFGVNLTDQSRNQALADIGSRDGSLATIDLQSASDTVSIGLVLRLLPVPWADLLSSCRTGEVECEGSLLKLEKWSSMGNGYTFELESLIFFGLMSGVVAYMRQVGEIGECQDAIIGVYGDDLIIPTNCYDLAVRTLSYCGFEVNSQKSFCHGPLRESCGADYFLGFDLRPYYLKKVLSDQVLYSFHNWCVRHGEQEIASICLAYTRSRLRLYGPDGYGDGHLIGSWILLRNRRVKRCGWSGGYFRTYMLLPKRDLLPLSGDALLPFYATYSGMSGEGPCDPFVIRGSNGYTRRLVYTTRLGVFH